MCIRDRCMDEASAAVSGKLANISRMFPQGLSGSVYMAGHSLGGIMLETWVHDNPDKAAGIILLGSYLPDLFGDHDNTFPVPVLTAVGELDGMTLSFVYREWEEALEAEAAHGTPGRYPVQVIDDANHGQVGTGHHRVCIPPRWPQEISRAS